MDKYIEKQEGDPFVSAPNMLNEQVPSNHMLAQDWGKEDVSRREECIKHFNLGTHRHQAVVYPTAVHYRDSDQDDWQEIDNTLEEAVTAHGRRVLRNRAGRVKMEFPQTMDGGDMASVSCAGRTFAWRFEEEMKPSCAAMRTGAQMKQDRLVKQAQKLPKFAGRTIESLQSEDLAAELETEQERRTDVVSLKAETAYADVLPGVSVRYELNGSSLKEDIILANRAALAHAAIRLPAEYAYSITDQNKLYVLDRVSGEKLFTMNPPLVYDAQNRQIIADIVLTQCDAYTRMEYRIAAGYLETACYPVTIDPVVFSSNDASNISDTSIANGSSSVVHGSDFC